MKSKFVSRLRALGVFLVVVAILTACGGSSPGGNTTSATRQDREASLQRASASSLVFR